MKPQRPTPQTFLNRLGMIAAKAAKLGEVVEKLGAGPRELALAMELNQQYIDTLDEMLDSDLQVTKNGKAML